jgi:hypothetical protein
MFWLKINQPQQLKKDVSGRMLTYKANEKFIQRIKSEGFTVIDIQSTYKSKFYDMEKQNIFN